MVRYPEAHLSVKSSSQTSAATAVQVGRCGKLHAAGRAVEWSSSLCSHRLGGVRTHLAEHTPPLTRRGTGLSTREFRLAPIDYEARDRRNRGLGKIGERLVLEREKQYLEESGRMDLAAKVEPVCWSIGDGLGYDFKSFDPSTGERKRAHFYGSWPQSIILKGFSQSFLLVSHATDDVHRRLREFSQFVQSVRREPEVARLLFATHPIPDKTRGFESLVHRTVGATARRGDARLVVRNGKWAVTKHAIQV